MKRILLLTLLVGCGKAPPPPAPPKPANPPAATPAALESLERFEVTAEFPKGVKVSEVCAWLSQMTGNRIETSSDATLKAGLQGTGSALSLLRFIRRETGLYLSADLRLTPEPPSSRSLVEAACLPVAVGGKQDTAWHPAEQKVVSLDMEVETRLGEIAGYFASILDLDVKPGPDVDVDHALPEIRVLDAPAVKVIQWAFSPAGLEGAIRGRDLLIGKPEWIAQQLNPGVVDPLALSIPPASPDADRINRTVIRRMARDRMTVQFKDTPLKDVLSYFADFTGIKVMFAEAPDSTVSMSGEMTFLEMLKKSLAPAGWRFVVDLGGIVVGSPDGIQGRFQGPGGLTDARALLEKSGIRSITVAGEPVLHVRREVPVAGITEESVEAKRREIAKETEALRPKIDERDRKTEEERNALIKKHKDWVAEAVLKKESLEKQLGQKLKENNLEGCRRLLEEAQVARDAGRRSIDDERMDAQGKLTEAEMKKLIDKGDRERDRLEKAVEAAARAEEDARKVEAEIHLELQEVAEDLHRKEVERAERLRENLVRKANEVALQFAGSLRPLDMKIASLERDVRALEDRKAAKANGELELPAKVTITGPMGRALENVVLHAANGASFTVEKGGWIFRIVDDPDAMKIKAGARDVDPVTLK